MNPQEEKTQAPETPVVEPQSPNTQTITSQSPVAQTAAPQNPTPQPQVVEGKKSHAWIIVLVIVLLLVAALIGAIIWTSSVFFKAAGEVSNSVLDEINKEIGTGDQNEKPSNTKSDSNPIIDANNKMRDELGSFDYDAVITDNAMGVSIETTMSCTFDGKNKLEYCAEKVGDILSQEVYYDYGNEFQYTKSVSSIGYGESNAYWMKTAMPKGSAAGIDIANSSSFSNYTSEKLDGGTMYSGTFEGFDGIGDAVINNGESENATEMSYKVFINNDGYIETIDMVGGEGQDMSQSLKISYKNFGTARSLSIPAEALNQ